MIFELVKDFAEVLESMPKEHPRYRILKLLNEAIRRDVHFMARHPTTLFQCMWNTCWWYDCPEAANHYEPQSDECDSCAPPWLHNGLKISALLEHWRMLKKQEKSGRYWLRALRPLPHCFGGGHGPVLVGHMNKITGVAVNEYDQLIVSGSHDFTIRVWHAQDGRELWELTGSNERIYGVAIPGRGSVIAAGYNDGMICLWDIYSGARIGSFSAHAERITSLVFSEDGKRLATSSHDGTIRLWELNSRNELFRFSSISSSDGPLETVAYSPDGKLLAAGARSGAIHLWNARNSQHLAVIPGRSSGTNGLAFSPNSERLASLGNGSVRVWNIQDRSEVWSKSLGQSYLTDLSPIAYSPNGRLLATGHTDSTVRLWNADSGELLQTISGHTGNVNCILFMHSGNKLVSGSDDKTVRVWSITEDVWNGTLHPYEFSYDNQAAKVYWDKLAENVSAITGYRYHPRHWLSVEESSGLPGGVVEPLPWELQRGMFKASITSVASGKCAAWWPTTLYMTRVHASGIAWISNEYAFTLESDG